jgi:hypothetical protein
MFTWWTELFASGAIGALVALVLAAFAVLLAGTAIIWTLVGLKWLGQQFMVGFRRSEPEHAHEQLGVADERPVDHR